MERGSNDFDGNRRANRRFICDATFLAWHATVRKSQTVNFYGTTLTMTDAGNGQSAFSTVYRSMVYRTTADICISNSTMVWNIYAQPGLYSLDINALPPFSRCVGSYASTLSDRTFAYSPNNASARFSFFVFLQKILTFHRDRFIVDVQRAKRKIPG